LRHFPVPLFQKALIMPTYEYECLECGNQFEAVQSMKDPHLTECPKCKGKVQRKIGRGAGIIFKGSGFYQTDYRSDSYKAAAKKDSEGSSSSSSTPKESSGSSSSSGGSSGASTSGASASPAPAPPAKTT
jgi:putative FmdB family regulatory protein